MQFDLDGARKAGASDGAIATFLAQRVGFDLEGARKAGAQDTQIAEYLANLEPTAPPPAPAPVPEDTSTVGGEFLKGLESGALMIPQAAIGAMRFATDVVGGDTTTADAQLAELGERQQAVAPAVGSFREANDSFGNAAKYVAHGFAQSLPMMATTMVTGGAGALIARQGAINLLGKEATKQIAKRTTMGAAAGSFAGSLPFELGEIEAGQAEQGIHKPWQALAYATPAAALEVVDDLLLLSKVPGIQLLKELPIFASKQGRGWFARGLQSAVEVAGVEGATEFVQTLLERGGADRSMLDAEAMEEALNAAILGAASGGIIGGAVGSLPSKSPTVQGDRPVDLTAADGGALTPEETAAADTAHAQGAGLQPPAPPPGGGAIPMGRTGPTFGTPLQPTTPVPVQQEEAAPAESPPAPQGAINFGPEYDAAYQEAWTRGATAGQAHQIGMEARQEAAAEQAQAVRTQKFAAIPAAAEILEAESIDAAANEAATSPTNDLPEPTPDQAAAGNYRVGKVNKFYPGLDISIENPAGSVRKGTDEDGKAWETALQDHYGYIRRTEGADGDQIDVFIPEGFVPDADMDAVFVVDQKNADGTFDEHKVIMGAGSLDEAADLYLRNYDASGPNRIMDITEMSVAEFKQWLKSDTTQPASAPAAPEGAAEPEPGGKTAGQPAVAEAPAPAVLTPERMHQGHTPDLREYYDTGGTPVPEADILPAHDYPPALIPQAEADIREAIDDAEYELGNARARYASAQEKQDAARMAAAYRDIRVQKEALRSLQAALPQPESQPSTPDTPAPEPPPAPPVAPPAPAAADPAVGAPGLVNTGALAGHFLADLRAGVKHDRKTMRQRAATLMGVPVTDLDPSKGYEHKYVEEAFEYGVVQRLREIMQAETAHVLKFRQIKELYDLQAGLSQRDSTSVALQQYSTPAPLAYLMQRWLGIDTDGTLSVYEPTAGNGMLVAGAKNPGNVLANELDSGPRLQHLRAQGFQVSNADAMDVGDPSMEGAFDRVVANPPFGTAAEVQEADGYPLKKIEHQIMAESLGAIGENGKAAFIIGGHNFKNGRMSETDRVFLNYLYSHYNVTHNIDIDGDVYRKQGTTFPIRLITIEGMKATPDATYAPERPSDVESAADFDAVAKILDAKEVANEFADSPGAPGDGSGGERGKPAGRPGRAPGGRGGRAPEGRQGDGDRSDTGGRGEGGKRGGDGAPLPDQGGTAGRDEPVQPPVGGNRGGLTGNLSPEDQAKLDALHEKMRGLLSPTKLNIGIDPELVTTGVQIAGLYMKAGIKTVEAIAVELARNLGEAIKPYVKAIYNQARTELQDPEMSSRAEVRAVDLDAIFAGIAQPTTPAPAAPAPTPASGLQTPYTPVSRGEAGQNLIPRNQAEGTQSALQKLVDAYGDLDTWVAGKLGYAAKEELYTTASGEPRLSAEQIDALALTIDAIDSGMGMIEGDMTGIGKGRVAAAIIRYANLQGLRPIFVTEKANLFSDMHRDLNDIGHEATPFIMSGNAEANVVGADGETVFHKQGGAGQKSAATYREMAENPSEYLANNGYDVLFTNYSQITRHGIQRTILSELAKENIVILDEAHAAGGEAAVGRGGRTPTPRRDAQGREKQTSAEYVRSMIAEAQGVLYMSATFAKRPGNMPLYYRTVLGTSGLSFADLTTAMHRGSVALQQVVSRFLTERGQHVRREQDFSHIKLMRTKTDEANKARDVKEADKLTAELRSLITFSNELNAEIDWAAVAAEAGHTASAAPDSFGIEGANFASIVHNYVAQMLLAIKASAVADEAVAVWDNGNGAKPIIGIMHTMGSFLNDLMAAEGLVVGDEIRQGFNAVLLKGLRNTLKYTVKDPRGNKTKHYMTEAQLARHAPDSYAVYVRLKRKLETLHTWVPGSPIDHMRTRMEQAGLRVGEITGRDLRINMDGDRHIIEKRSRQDRDRKRAIKAFNLNQDPGYDALIINRAGSTGLSLHPTKDIPQPGGHHLVTDKRPRHMIIAQADLNVDTVVQMLGRIFRKGQVERPSYTFFNTALPAETRPAVVLEKKLKSMSANTTADSSSAFSQDVPDMLNEYGDAMVVQWLQANRDINDTLNDPVGIAGGGNGQTEDAFRKVSGKIALFSAALQEQFYTEVSEMFTAHIEYLDEIGQNNLETKNYDYRARTVRTDILHAGTDPDNPFATDAVLEEVVARNLRKPFSRKTLEEMIHKALGGQDPLMLMQDQRTAMRAASAEWLDVLNQRRDEAVAAEKSTLGIDATIQDARRTLEQAEEMLEQFQIGSSHELMLDEETGVRVPAVVTGVSITTSSGNPAARSKIKFTFALAHANQSLRLRMVQYGLLAGSRQDFRGTIRNQWDNLIPQETESTQYIVTGNLLAGYARVEKGSIINFTRADGTQAQGILVPETKHDTVDELRSVRAVGAAEAAAWMLAQSREHVVALPTNQGRVVIFRDTDTDTYQLRVPHTKKDGGRYFLDQPLVDLMEGARGFQDVGSGGRKSKVGRFPESNLRAVLDRLYDMEVRFMVRNEEGGSLPTPAPAPAPAPPPSPPPRTALAERIAREADAKQTPLSVAEHLLAAAYLESGADRVQPDNGKVLGKLFQLAAGNADNRFGAPVERVGYNKAPGQRTFTIQKPYGQLIYDEGANTLVLEPGPLMDASRVADARFKPDTENLLPTLMKDIVNNDLEGTLVNELVQNALDSFPARRAAKGRHINLQVDRIYRWDSAESNGDMTVFTVTDNGTGMTQAQVKQHFLGLGAKGKSGTDTRGGYGLAKAAFLLAPASMELRTTKGGQTTTLRATRGELISGAKLDLLTRPQRPGEAEGTELKLSLYADRNEAKSLGTYEADPAELNTKIKQYIKNLRAPATVTYTDIYGQEETTVVKPLRALKQAFDPVKLDMLGNTLTVYFIPSDGPFSSYQGKYSIPISTYNKGLLLQHIEAYNYNLKGMYSKPGFEVVVEFDETTAVSSMDYPFIQNRTRLNGEIARAVKDAVDEKTQARALEQFEMEKAAFRAMMEAAPEVAGIKVLIPFTDPKDVSTARGVFNKNTDLFQSMAEVYAAFNNMLEASGEKRIDLAITVDPGIHGFRSNPNVVGYEVYAINPFSVDATLMLNEFYIGYIEQGNDPSFLRASSFVHTLVHEYNHSLVQGHDERYTKTLAVIYSKLTHTNLAALEEMLYDFYEKYGDRASGIHDDLRNLGKSGSRLRTGDGSVLTSESSGAAGQPGVAADATDGGRQTGPAALRGEQDLALATDGPTLSMSAVERIQGAIDRALAGLPVRLQIVGSIDPDHLGDARASFAAHGVEGGKIAGVHTPLTGLDGTVQSVIRLALDGATEATGYHELFHAAESQGLISAADQAVLDRKYPAGQKSGRETRADAYARWSMGDKANIPAVVQRIFQQLRETFERIGNALRGLGYRSADDVFRALESGALAKGEGNRGTRRSSTPTSFDVVNLQGKHEKTPEQFWGGVTRLVQSRDPNTELDFMEDPYDSVLFREIEALWESRGVEQLKARLAQDAEATFQRYRHYPGDLPKTTEDSKRAEAVAVELARRAKWEFWEVAMGSAYPNSTYIADHVSGLQEDADTLEMLGGPEGLIGQLTDIIGKPLAQVIPFSGTTDFSLATATNPTPAQQAVRTSLREKANGVIDRLDRFIASPLLSLENAKEFYARRHRALGALGAIKEETSRLYKLFRDAAGEDAQAIYAYLTTKDADLASVPERWRKATETAKQTVERIGELLVSHGLLPEDVMEQHRGEYLPRVYLKHLLGDENVAAISSGKGLNLSYTKKRRNLPEEQRNAMGEVLDPAYLVSRAYSIPMRDMAILDWLSDIARHAEWVLPGSLVEWSWQENPGYQLGPWRYTTNADGTFNLQRIQRKRRVIRHEAVPAADLESFFGSATAANALRAGKGKAAQRKTGTSPGGHPTFTATGWKRFGKWYQYKKNADGTFTIKASTLVETAVDKQNVSPEALPGVVGENRAEAMLEHAEVGRRTATVDPFDWNKGKAKGYNVGKQVRGKPRLQGGKLVSVFWLAQEAERIRKQVHTYPEATRASAERTAERMEALVKEFGPPEGTQLPAGWAQVPMGRKYGPLAGMAVRKEIVNDLVGVVQNTIGDTGATGKLDKVLRKTMRTWKWAKTAANVSGQVRNFVSNGLMLGLSGVPWHRVAPLMARAFGEIRRNGAYWKIAKRYGVTEATFSNTELARIETAFLDMLQRQGDAGFLSTIGLWFGKFENLTGDVYQLMEALGKTAKIIDAIERQELPAADAAMEAHKWLFDYSDVRQEVKTARESYLGIPFLTYTLKVLPRVLDSMLNHPMQAAPLMAGAAVLPYLIAHILDVDEDDYEKLMEAMPEWIRERGHVYLLPVKDEYGRWKVVDIGYFFPWSAWSEAARSLGRLAGEDREFADLTKLLSGLGVGGSPIWDISTAIQTGIDPFTERPIVDEYAPPAEKLQQVLLYAYNMAAPTWINLGGRGFLGKEVDALTGTLDSQGRPRSSHVNALARLVGVNLYDYDPNESREWNIKRMERELEDTESAMKKRLRNPNTSDADYERIVTGFSARMDRVVEKLQRYIEDSESSLLYR
ncbi:MAG: strawberry notch family protein [Deferrisomatales bacterium]|nr:strawberry notch family protein [Deferrisomatales bacterium]